MNVNTPDIVYLSAAVHNIEPIVVENIYRLGHYDGALAQATVELDRITEEHREIRIHLNALYGDIKRAIKGDREDRDPYDCARDAEYDDPPAPEPEPLRHQAYDIQGG